MQSSRLVCAYLLIGAISAGNTLWAQPARPNVVILFTDDQGTLDAGCYGSADLKTPTIDRLAARGIRFTQAYAHTVCCPSRAALLTGRHPQRGGVHFWTQGNIDSVRGINMSIEEVTLAESLRAAGYRTALFGKWHLGAHRESGPKKQGFDEFFGIRDGFIDNYTHHFLHADGYHDLFEGTERVHKPGDYFPQLMVDRCLAFLEQNRQRPFFLYAPFNIPHYPEQSLDRFAKEYATIDDPARRSYAAMISTTDFFMGQIIEKLESLSLLDSTIILFMSDNGHSEETKYRIKPDDHSSGLPKGHFYGASGGGNTGRWIGHKGTFLEGGIRVPAVISFPAVLPQGEVRDQIVTAMDWYPTILELCGITRPASAPQLDGHSLMPIIADPAADSAHRVLHFQWGKKWAIRKGDWKLIGAEGSTRKSLFRLSDERPESIDHSKAQADLVATLTRLHNEWAANVSGEN